LIFYSHHGNAILPTHATLDRPVVHAVPGQQRLEVLRVVHPGGVGEDLPDQPACVGG
jgi:hypothetical protein